MEIAISVLSLLIAHVSCEEFNLCPSISQGYPPYCACRHGGAYDNVTNTCLDPECPAASIAEPAYPNCTCTEPNFAYTAYVNECFRVCPENSTGYWPDCTCDNEFAIFDKSTLIRAIWNILSNLNAKFTGTLIGDDKLLWLFELIIMHTFGVMIDSYWIHYLYWSS